MCVIKKFFLYVIVLLSLQISFADENGPIEQSDEVMVIEVPKTPLDTPLDGGQENKVLKKLKKTTHESATTGAMIETPILPHALELKEFTTANYANIPRQFIPNSTTLGSLELSSKPKWIQPIDKLTIVDAKIDPTSVQSYDAQAKGMTYCSWISRNNLERLTKLQDRDSVKNFDGRGILVGDAITIIEQGLKANIFKEVYLNDGSIEKYMSRVQRHTKATLFDIYIHHTKIENKFFAGHRITGFLGTDNKWYILDPVMMHHQDPMPVSEYFKKFGKEDQDHVYILKNGYAPAGYEVESYPIMSVKYFSELQPLLQSEDISVTTSGTETKIAFNTDIRFLAEYTFFDVAAGTIMTMKGEMEDTFSLTGAGGQDLATGTLAWRSLGGRDRDIRFSQPVKITLLTDIDTQMMFTPMIGGLSGDLLSSYTSNKYASCYPDGSVQQDDHVQTFQIIDKKAQFYSCAGAAFSIVPGFALGVEVFADGQAPFHDHSYDGVLYQGQDGSGSNALVRAGDQMMYAMHLAGAKTLGNSLGIDISTIDIEQKSRGVFESIPSDCLATSSISADKKTLHCDIAASLLQDHFVFQVPVRVDANVENNAEIQLSLKTLYRDMSFTALSPKVTVTNFFDNSKLTQLTETVKNTSEQLVDGMKELLMP